LNLLLVQIILEEGLLLYFLCNKFTSFQ
jgi:hypothetical protein